MKRSEIDQKDILIEDITPNGITMKIIYASPELMSMSDQTVQDRMVADFEGPKIMGANGLELNKKVLPKDENGNSISMNDIQPMVNEEA